MEFFRTFAVLTWLHLLVLGLVFVPTAGAVVSEPEKTATGKSSFQVEKSSQGSVEPLEGMNHSLPVELPNPDHPGSDRPTSGKAGEIGLVVYETEEADGLLSNQDSGNDDFSGDDYFSAVDQLGVVIVEQPQGSREDPIKSAAGETLSRELNSNLFLIPQIPSKSNKSESRSPVQSVHLVAPKMRLLSVKTGSAEELMQGLTDSAAQLPWVAPVHVLPIAQSDSEESTEIETEFDTRSEAAPRIQEELPVETEIFADVLPEVVAYTEESLSTESEIATLSEAEPLNQKELPVETEIFADVLPEVVAYSEELLETEPEIATPSEAESPIQEEHLIEPQPQEQAFSVELAGEEPHESAADVDSSESDDLGDERPIIYYQPAVPVDSFAGEVKLMPSMKTLEQAMTRELQSNLSLFPSDGKLGLERETFTTPLFRHKELGASCLFGTSLWPTGGHREQEGLDVFRAAGRRPFKERFSDAVDQVQSDITAMRRKYLRRGYDHGVGVERLPFALFELDPSQPFNNFRIRYDAAFKFKDPSRAEYLWASPEGLGPGTESSLNYQHLKFQFETGGPRLTVGTEIPLVYIDPEQLDPTAGMGDMVLTTKTLLIDGNRLQLMQVLRTQMATGSPGTGRGNGHVSMEPGVVAGYRCSKHLMAHGEVKLWFPLGGNTNAGGEILRYGGGVASVIRDSDSFAIIATCEAVAWTILSGKHPNGELLDGTTIVNAFPGLRYVYDGLGDMGLFELGLNAGISVSGQRWYRHLARLELRWSF